MGLREQINKMPDRYAWLKEIASTMAKGLFDVKVLVIIFGSGILTTTTCNHAQTVHKQDEIAAKQDTVEVKQEKIDSTATMQIKWQQRRDSINKIRDAKEDSIIRMNKAIVKYFNIKF